MSQGETNLSNLLASLEPKLLPDEYVYVVLSPAKLTLELIDISRALIREDEGVTLVLCRAAADDHGLEYDCVMRWIALTVHSSLEAVGLTAAIATELGRYNIPANVLAAGYHDHILTPERHAERALRVLRDLAASQALNA